MACPADKKDIPPTWCRCSSFALLSSDYNLFVMLSLRLVVVFASLLGFSVSQGPTPSPTPSSTGAATPAPWSGCVDPNNPNKPEIIQIGNPTTICLTLGPGGNWAAGVRYGRYTWRPIADQYSKFHIPKCKLIRNIVNLTTVMERNTFLLKLLFQRCQPTNSSC